MHTKDTQVKRRLRTREGNEKTEKDVAASAAAIQPTTSLASTWLLVSNLVMACAWGYVFYKASLQVPSAELQVAVEIALVVSCLEVVNAVLGVTRSKPTLTGILTLVLVLTRTIK